MSRFSTLLLFLIFCINTLKAAEVRGRVIDSKTGELLVGCNIVIEELIIGTTTGLDGTYVIKNVPEGKYSLQCSYISYESQKTAININNENKVLTVNFRLETVTTQIGEISVYGHRDLSTETSARKSERNSANLMNVVSARTIELSPDLDVAGVIQRMSGVTLEKNTSGSGQYAILRGMDKRYSYTLINGIKIPSTNDKHRYVSLNIFPSDLEDRVEVSKVLTPDMEGDAIAGAINLVMKNAPARFMVQANAALGYSTIWSSNKFMTFDKTPINLKPPYEIHGEDYYALPSDFPKSCLDPEAVNMPVNTTAGFAIGNRFFQKSLGWILAASYNENYKGAKSLIFGEDQSTDGSNLPRLTKMTEQFDYNHQKNYGIHNKFDFTISPKHSVQLYTAYMFFGLTQIRDQEKTEFQNNSYDPEHGGENDSHSDRNKVNLQDIFNTTLQGLHYFGNHFSVNWSATYSRATNQTPNMSTVSYYETYVNFTLQPQYVDYEGSERIWLRNKDQDKAGYLDLKYKFNPGKGSLELSTGGLYRDKNRSSFVCSYILDPQGPVDNHSAKGIDWNTYSEINWSVRDPLGAANVPGTYNAYERVRAAYGMFTYQIFKFQAVGGVRYEYTAQGYDEVFHNAFLDKFQPDNDQKRDHLYKFLLPGLSLKYALNDKNNIKASYFKAINKPGFYEIVPYNDNTGDYPKTGNPDLKNAVADNLDLRYEFFPTQLDQILAGFFYKNIKDAIEEGFTVDGHGNYNLTYSNSDAVNYGFEADIIKFFREFGIKGNYTWTHSQTSSYKRSQVNGVVNRDSTVSSLEYRPLYGQSEHVGNLSFLYKGTKNGLNAQLALSYTGERIYKVSADLNSDYWQKGFWQLDASAEKKFKHFGIFIKAKNLLNTHVKVYIKQVNSYNSKFPYHSATDKTTLIRDEFSGRSYLIGFRYKF